MNNISFQGKSLLVLNPSDYNIANKKAIKLRKNYTSPTPVPSQLRMLRNWYTIETDPTHLNIFLTNGDKTIMTKISILEKLEDKLVEIENFITELLTQQNKGKKHKVENSVTNQPIKKLTAWILGGDKVTGKHGNETIEALDSVAEILCDKPNIDTSILTASQSGNDTFGIHVLQDTFELLFNGEKKNLTNYFDIVELNNVDHADKITFLNCTNKVRR